MHITATPNGIGDVRKTTQVSELHLQQQMYYNENPIAHTSTIESKVWVLVSVSWVPFFREIQQEQNSPNTV